MVQQVITVSNVTFSYEDMLKLRSLYRSYGSGGIDIKGDGHGNWRNVLLTAQIQGIAEVSEKDHNALNKLYDLPIKEVTREQLNEFIKILNRIKFTPQASYKLIGDLLADRGQCDLHTLILIATMKKQGIDLSILLSNHDREFLRIWINKFQIDDSLKNMSDLIPVFDTGITNGRNGQDESLQALGDLLINEVVTVDEVNKLVDVYIDSLKLIDYQLPPDKQSIALTTHAPFAVINYKELAQALDNNIVFDDTTPEKLAASIDQMNAKYRQFLTGKELAENIDKLVPLLKQLTWNRWNTSSTDGMPLDKQEQFQPTHNGYNVYYIHGHDGPHCVPREKQSFVTSVDSHFAKMNIKVNQPDLILYHWDGGDLTLQHQVVDIRSLAVPPSSNDDISVNSHPASDAKSVPMSPSSSSLLSAASGTLSPTVDVPIPVRRTDTATPTVNISPGSHSTVSPVSQPLSQPSENAPRNLSALPNDLSKKIDEKFVETLADTINKIVFPQNHHITVTYEEAADNHFPSLVVHQESKDYHIEIEQDSLLVSGENCNIYCYETMLQAFRLQGEKCLILDCENLVKEEAVKLVTETINHGFVFELNSADISLEDILPELNSRSLAILKDSIRNYPDATETQALLKALNEELARRINFSTGGKQPTLFPSSCSAEANKSSDLNPSSVFSPPSSKV